MASSFHAVFAFFVVLFFHLSFRAHAEILRCQFLIHEAAGYGSSLTFTESFRDARGDTIRTQLEDAGESTRHWLDWEADEILGLGSVELYRNRDELFQAARREASESQDFHHFAAEPGRPDGLRLSSSDWGQAASNEFNCLYVLNVDDVTRLIVHFPTTVMTFSWHPDRPQLAVRLRDGRLYLVHTEAEVRRDRLSEITLPRDIDLSKIDKIAWRGDRLVGGVGRQVVVLYDPERTE